MIDGNTMTVTGRTLGENLDRWTHKYGELDWNQDVIRPLNKPIKDSGHIRFVLTLSSQPQPQLVFRPSLPIEPELEAGAALSKNFFMYTYLKILSPFHSAIL